jgi:hypothetical protein
MLDGKRVVTKDCGSQQTMHDFSPDLERFLRYLAFKQDCVWHQYMNPVRLDYDKAVECRDVLLSQQEEKVSLLTEVMPKVKKMKWQNKPKRTHKKDGSLSVAGTNWFKACKENGLNPASKAAKEADKLKVFSHWEDPNPNSPDQVKDWLFSLGWKPCTFKYVKEDDGSERKIPQVRKDGELVPSVEVLIEDNPELEHLAGLTVIQHRLGIFKGFIECAIDQDGKYYLRAEIGGLTNTLRFKHKKPLVNLPGVEREWGEEIRSCLIADDGEVFVGADLVSLEDTTKRHLIKPLDPDYVEEMSQPGYDPHLSLALYTGEITQDEYDNYSENPDKRLASIRKAYKVTNYSAVYGVGAPKLAREMGISVGRAKDLLEGYWRKNWAVKKVAEQQYTKDVAGYTWLKNPVSGFWHQLRYDKDRFSTTNQSTGVFIFDSWLARARLRGYMGMYQSHDETARSSTDPEYDLKALEWAIEKLNQDLKLNVEFHIDCKTGQNYAEVH